jgi:hypothetical protein
LTFSAENFGVDDSLTNRLIHIVGNLNARQLNELAARFIIGVSMDGMFERFQQICAGDFDELHFASERHDRCCVFFRDLAVFGLVID